MKTILRTTYPFFNHLSIMWRDVKVINLMFQMDIDCEVDLENLFVTLDETKFYTGRPEMVLMEMSNGRNFQFFRKGVIQLLGAVSPSEAQLMRYELKHRLKKVVNMENCQIPEMKLKNMVVSAQLNKGIRLRKISTGNRQLQYDGEVFPAALITKWAPAHVSVFKNGIAIITGLKTASQTYFILNSLVKFLNKRSLFS